ncbi:MarR family winged helix-turn-helix transcriptional regulator [Conexibacter woesei]|uniref:MarR family winged helix-turn-helix transcriptional regulator n=1 Tax=Conexibacter woesei TaxID=191495 RepID=UPI0009DC3B98|nr:MarR family transcriptional regulator [Conexibacter woesei]
MTPTRAVKDPATVARAEAVEQVAGQLLPRASLVTRLLVRRGSLEVTRAEAGLLSGLLDGPQRITEIAATQALAQPTVTQLVARLEERGLVARNRHPDDGRVVLVTITDAGRALVEAFREEYRTFLRDHLAQRDDDEVRALAAATELLQEIVESLQAELRA